MGFSLKKEMMADALFVREIATFRYEILSLDFQGMNRQAITTNIQNEFRTKYSGDINVKVFEVPTDYSFPNDTIRVGKYNVEVQVRSVPPVSTWQPELDGTNNYYKGLGATFFVNSGKNLLDFKEGYNFEINENGNQVFSHDISFGILTGNKAEAIGIASGIFSQDKSTSFGITSMVNTVSQLADPTVYQNFYTETYNTLRNQYSFSRKREVLPSGATAYVYNLVHVLDTKDDGIMDVTEKGSVRGKLSFNAAQVGMETLIGSSFVRCNAMYSTYTPLANAGFNMPALTSLVAIPFRTTRMLTPRALAADYEVGYTNNQQFRTDGTVTNELFELQDDVLGIINLKHTLDFTYNKRIAPATTFATLIDTATTNSPAAASGYFQTMVRGVNGYNASAPDIHHIKKEIAWPNRKNKGAKVMMEYSNHPKYFVDINGMSFRVLEAKVDIVIPPDMVTEYKIINRPSKFSLMNYAYQTDRGQVTVTVDAAIGRNPDEFITTFRSDLGSIVANLYQYASTLFFNGFKGAIPLAFTYYLQDMKFAYNSDQGGLQVTAVFGYTMKKHTL